MDPLWERERDERKRLVVQHAPLNPYSKALLTLNPMVFFFVCEILTLLKVEQAKPFYLSKSNMLTCSKRPLINKFTSSEINYHRFHHPMSLEMLQDDRSCVAASFFAC